MVPIFQVKETPCYPNAWHVYPVRWYRPDNATRLYFRSRAEAQKEADRLNKAHEEAHGHD